MIVKLKDPGVGPPWIARAFNRWLIKPLVIRRAAWPTSIITLDKAQAKLERQLKMFSPEEAIERVLVPPQTGLEDSSRYWSAALTARHLTIVGTAIESAIIELSHNRLPKQKADTAKVKPELELNEFDSIVKFLEFSKDQSKRIESKVAHRDSQVKHAHPWFGEMTAKDWLWLLGVHSLIHLRQLNNIKMGLQKS
jgi:hypothetical protein